MSALFFLITANPLSNDSSQLSRKQITWYHQTKQCPTNQDSIAEDIYQSFVTKKCVWKSKVWRRKKHLRWQPAGSLRPYESKSCGKKVCLKKKKTKSGEEKTSKMTACWEPEASCSLCNQTLEGHPEDYTMIFPPPARWEKGGKNGLSSFFIQSWGWTLISHVVPHDLKNRARVMILW